MVDTKPNSISEEEFETVYETVSKKLLIFQDDNIQNSYDGIFATMLKKFKEEFDIGGLTNDQIAIAKSQFFASAYNTIETQANSSALHILDSKASETLVNAKIDLTNREVQGYDDGLRIKKAEFEGNVASFAINAGAANAQEVLDRFNNSINEITNFTSFGEILINDILDTDVLLTGSVSGIYAKEGDIVYATANTVTTSATINSGGFFEIVVDANNLTSLATVAFSCTVSDSNANTIELTASKVVT